MTWLGAIFRGAKVADSTKLVLGCKVSYFSQKQLMCGLFTFQILMSASQRLAMEEVLAGTK